MLGRHAEAQAKYRQGIELAPDFLALRNNYGLSLAISGQPQEAIAQLAPLASQPRPPTAACARTSPSPTP